jgi:hypothetical protein
MLIWPRKTEGEHLDYAVDWQDQLAEGESITSSTWSLLDSSGTQERPHCMRYEAMARCGGRPLPRESPSGLIAVTYRR